MGRSGQAVRRVDRGETAQQEPELRQLLDRAEAIAGVPPEPTPHIKAAHERGRHGGTSACAESGPIERSTAAPVEPRERSKHQESNDTAQDPLNAAEAPGEIPRLR